MIRCFKRHQEKVIHRQDRSVMVAVKHCHFRRKKVVYASTGTNQPLLLVVRHLQGIRQLILRHDGRKDHSRM